MALQGERIIPLEIYNLASHTFAAVIHVQQPNAAPWLAAAIVRAPRIEQQLPIHLFIPGNVAMPEHHTTSIGKFLSRHLRAIMRLTQDMHDADAAMPHYNFALDRQLQPYLV